MKCKSKKKKEVRHITATAASLVGTDPTRKRLIEVEREKVVMGDTSINRREETLDLLACYSASGKEGNRE